MVAQAERNAVRRPRRGRRPADEVREEVLQAAGELLFADGMSGFTIEKVAALSGASKMTIYKWWPSKGALALDGYFRKVEPELGFPDTGEIERDLRVQLRAFLGVIRDTVGGGIIGELIGQAQLDPDLKAAFLQRYSGPRRALAVAALRRAQERGQLDATTDPEVVVDQLWGACYHRLLVPDQPLTADFVDALLANVLWGIKSR
ncbi:TetR family transcriptional regulator [Mycobacteroides chelonae]|jgi:AcrR family transcriptional regulator|uniref:TetR family transcriptional regulator n=1 Tax=Mycobacteroides chelonae TaxID=1774 RepID=A0A1S1LTI4_MYCCH|nr:TetR family transcriptional regulator [Mycobacteroides sp. H003]KRQ34466.1 TetR family transcriptional regulator [Mycobacteroides sp. H092]KRQ41450.1 TetR family transcriptional regulator [Mycobacteroides sp. H101]KRQ43402.1 TetR family transcriptional regulator [Mycobacteroides sp. H063]KRQ58035.1 TetR family transcriptional regulator [Mycobacteroides sp. HXVII]KRQ65631.1 TetR family transcriptional regulator [Mycobacteroides sp. H079]KRQ73650.1 TetR family transcriptional regulator [Myco